MLDTVAQTPSSPEPQPPTTATDTQQPPKCRAALGIASIVMAVLAAILLHGGITINNLTSVNPGILWGALGGMALGVVLCAVGLALALAAMIRKHASNTFVFFALLLNFAALGSAVLRWIEFSG
ncbi:MAG: hypothetical protein NTU53_22650 [Planctomycetota bacterium]|nr:hypothetical protein [Planctomycetota bacterium]